MTFGLERHRAPRSWHVPQDLGVCVQARLHRVREEVSDRTTRCGDDVRQPLGSVDHRPVGQLAAFVDLGRATAAGTGGVGEGVARDSTCPEQAMTNPIANPTAQTLTGSRDTPAHRHALPARPDRSERRDTGCMPETRDDPMTLPADLPKPVDDGAADHPPNPQVPARPPPATDGRT